MRLRRARDRASAVTGTASSRYAMLAVRPPDVLIEEEYRLEQEVSETRPPAIVTSSTGKVEMFVGYDGEPFLAWHSAREPAPRATVGHIAFDGHHDTDLGESCRRSTLTLQVPVLPCGIPRRPETAADGSREYEWSLDYETRPSALASARLDVRIDDLDSDDVRDGVLTVGATNPLDELQERWIGHSRHRPALAVLVRLVLEVLLPQDRTPPSTIMLRSVAVELPGLTSLDRSALGLEVPMTTAALQHDPEARAVRWFDVPLAATPSPRGAGGASRRWTYRSHQMVLKIEQPGELFESKTLRLRGEVELEGLLLSGTRAGLFDTRGHRDDRRLTQRTVLDVDCQVLLADVFDGRRVSPYQALVFDELIPDKARTRDVRSALETLGYQVTREVDSWDLNLVTFFDAEQGAGPAKSRLYLLVRGRRGSTRRRTEHGEGRQYSSRVESGDITVFVRGDAVGSPTGLVSQMNDLHVHLKERFSPLRSAR